MEPGSALADIARRHDLTLVVLFGSRATGRAHAGSDTDVAVMSASGPLSLEDRRTLPLELEAATGLPDIDLVDLRRASPLLAHAIGSSGRVLHESEAGAWNVFRVRAWRLYLDDRETLRRLDGRGIERALSRQGS